ncbi:EI24 domain-containing protein [Thioclava sp.]|uniref:EI24 domain-containing protein n=1 Tax=Thioclava sp. TaxID=1933450 RepID=UPI003242E573
MIISSYVKAWADLLRPGAMKVVGFGVALSLGLLVAIYVAMVMLIGWLIPDSFSLPFIGEIGHIDTALSIVSAGVILFASIFLMVPVASAFTGFFLEDVAEMVEDVHYPTLPPVRKLTFAEGMRDTVRFFGVILVANIIALMIYPFVIPLAPFLFFGLNGYLLGREYFQMAAFRRMEREAALELYERNKVTIWAAGALMAVPLSIPLVNLFVPVLGAAGFTHLFHAITGRRG